LWLCNAHYNLHIFFTEWKSHSVWSLPAGVLTFFFWNNRIWQKNVMALILWCVDWQLHRSRSFCLLCTVKGARGKVSFDSQNDKYASKLSSDASPEAYLSLRKLKFVILEVRCDKYASGKA
jgi:hypothetical protein